MYKNLAFNQSEREFTFIIGYLLKSPVSTNELSFDCGERVSKYFTLKLDVFTYFSNLEKSAEKEINSSLPAI